MESRRTLVAALTVAAVALIVAGIAAVAIDSGPSGGSAPTGPVTASPSGSVASATPSPTAPPVTPSGLPGSSPSNFTPVPTMSASPGPHNPGFAVRGGSIVYYTSDGTVVPVEPVPGLRATIAGDQVTYSALAGNRYGLRAGAYAGEFMPNVSIQQDNGSSARTGGVVVVGSVAVRLISDALAAITSPADRWIVALPVDIRGTTKPVDVSFDSYGLVGLTYTPRVLVQFSDSLPVVNVIPDNSGYHVLVEQLGVTLWQVIDPTRLGLSSATLDPDHLMNELLLYGNGTPSVSRDVVVNRRVEIGHPMLFAAGEVSVSLTVRGSYADLSPSRVLKIADVPVFVASS